VSGAAGKPHLSVVVPAFNEEARLDLSLRTIEEYFEDCGHPYEIIVVDDGSTDRTAAIAEGRASLPRRWGKVRWLSNEANRGKGFSVRRGMLAAEEGLALLTDADLSTPIAEFDKLREAVASRDCDLAFGSRDLSGSEVRVPQPWWRETLGKGFNRFVRLSTFLPYRDTQCGFKLFRMASCRELFRRQRLAGFAFDVEILFLARKWGLRAEELPVVWCHAEGSKVGLGHAPSIVIDLVRLHLNNARGLYDR
jgi:dolichyl-phosphate beta-glucosyltransferase